MRRLLNPVVRDLTARRGRSPRTGTPSGSRPADPTLLGLLRILTGLMLLYTHAVWGLVLGEFFGPVSWLSPALVRAIQARPVRLLILVACPRMAGCGLSTAFSMAVLLLFTVGLCTRVTSILSLLVVISFAHRVPQATFGLDQINAMLTLVPGHRSERAGPLARPRHCQATAGPGRVASAAPSARANLALRLINVHMCVIYFFAGISKLQGEAWWTGEAMWRAFSNLEYQSIDMTWLAWHPWLLNLVTHICLFSGKSSSVSSSGDPACDP